MDDFVVCENCFNRGELCKCESPRITSVPLSSASIDLDDAAEQLTYVLVGNDLKNFISDFNTKLYENQFEIRKDNQIMLLYCQFIYDCLTDNEPEKKEIFERTGKCPWLHWKPLL